MIDSIHGTQVARTSYMRRSKTRGFTLVELMAVVVIVAILAGLALVGYRQMISSAKTTEATEMVSEIRIAQTSYRTDTGRYANIGWTRFCPQDTSTGTIPSGSKAMWNSACPSTGTLTWQALPVTSKGPFAFGYVTASGAVSDSIPTSLAGVTWSTGFGDAGAADDWYIIGAASDIDGQGGANSVIIGSSFSNETMVRNEGQ